MWVKTVNILLYAYNNGAAVYRSFTDFCLLYILLLRGSILRRLSCAICATSAQYSHCQKCHEKNV